MDFAFDCNFLLVVGPNDGITARLPLIKYEERVPLEFIVFTPICILVYSVNKMENE